MVDEQTLYRQQLQEEDRLRRRRKSLVVMLLLFLILLLLLLFLLYMFYTPRGAQRVRPDQPIQFLFSVYGLNKPLGVATDEDDQIYVSDTNSQRVLVFDSDGDFVRRIGTDSGPSKVFAVDGLVVDDEMGRVYIADWTSRVVHAFTKSGRLLFKFPENPIETKYGTLGFTPFDVDIYKERIFVTSNDGVHIFDNTGKFLDHWGTKGSQAGQFDFPNGIVVDQKNGDVYVADVLNRRVVAMDNKGTWRWVLGKPDIRATEKIVSFFGLPRGITMDDEGNLFVADTFHNEIVVLKAADGLLTGTVGTNGVQDGEFSFPEGIARTEDGVFYLADRENDRVQAFRIQLIPEPNQLQKAKYEDSFTEFK